MGAVKRDDHESYRPQQTKSGFHVHSRIYKYLSDRDLIVACCGPQGISLRETSITECHHFTARFLVEEDKKENKRSKHSSSSES